MTRDPQKRILAKILGDKAEVDRFEATGEPLDRVIALLRDIAKMRKTRQWLIDHAGIDPAVDPETFHQLLDNPRINFVEKIGRNLEVEFISLKETRRPEDPVTVSNLNVLLRELYRAFNEAREKLRNEHKEPLLAGEITEDKIVPAAELAAATKNLHGQVTGYLFTFWKVRKLEEDFRALFPGSEKAHPLRRYWPMVEHELELYRMCAESSRKWRPLGLDLLDLLRRDMISPAMENLEEIGTLLWNVVYNQPQAPQSLELTGIDFGDMSTLFDNEKVTVHNF